MAAHMMEAHITESPVDMDSGKTFIRRTRGNRHLAYVLKVVQQPERARACGSGPKSCSDRRPVDPPPVVELRVYEATEFDGETKTYRLDKDITFNYNANFFLFATLEHARVIAPGRGQTSSIANTPPVLTGMPVSGMAYLDRPQEAGYFLFPDLSVRHEGVYRLTFNLYEETKEDRDKDPPKPEDNQFPSGSFDWRMEVQSNDFTVFSAKKFPGLSESTLLSRTVADQGCRVRIRRDVRMRRRENTKPSGNGDFDNDNAAEARRQRTRTPDSAKHQEYRSRSMSGSVDASAHYGAQPQRRPSRPEYQSGAPAPPPAFPPSQAPSNGHLSFGHGHCNNPTQQTQTSSGHASPVPRSPSYPSAQSGYPHPHSASPYGPAHLDRPQSQHHGLYSGHHASPSRESFPPDARRMSGSAGDCPRPMTPQSARESDSFGSRMPFAHQPASTPAKAEPPTPRTSISAHALPSIHAMIHDPAERSNSAAAAIPSPDSDKGCRGSISVAQSFPRLQPAPPQPQSPYHHDQFQSQLKAIAPCPPALLPAPAPQTRKRSYADANPGHNMAVASLGSKDRQRPETHAKALAPVSSIHMTWKRADGSLSGKDHVTYYDISKEEFLHQNRQRGYRPTHPGDVRPIAPAPPRGPM